MLKKRKTTGVQEINAGSMADIAFLLLIFFLVTTKILSDQGILVVLPPYVEESPPYDQVNDRNVLSVHINAGDQILVEEDEVLLANLREQVILFITNPHHAAHLADNPRHAVVSLVNDRGTSYAAYLGVYNELKAAYQQIWDAEAEARYSLAYEALPERAQRAIRSDFPFVVSEAEPTDFE